MGERKFRSLFINNGTAYDEEVVYDDTTVDAETLFPGMGYEGRRVMRVPTTEEADAERERENKKRTALMLEFGFEQNESFDFWLMMPDELFYGMVKDEYAKLIFGPTGKAGCEFLINGVFGPERVTLTEDEYVACHKEEVSIPGLDLMTNAELMAAVYGGKQSVITRPTAGVAKLETESKAIPQQRSRLEEELELEGLRTAISADEPYLSRTLDKADLSDTCYSISTHEHGMYTIQDIVDENEWRREEEQISEEDFSDMCEDIARGYNAVGVTVEAQTDVSDTTTTCYVDYYKMYLQGECDWDGACELANQDADRLGWPKSSEVQQLDVTYSEFMEHRLYYCPYVVEAILEEEIDLGDDVAQRVQDRETGLLIDTEYLTALEVGGGNTITLGGLGSGVSLMGEIMAKAEDTVTEDEIKAAEDDDIVVPHFIASAETEGHLVGSEVNGIIWEYTALDDTDGLSWVDVGCKGSIVDDIPIVLNIADEVKDISYRHIGELINTKTVDGAPNVVPEPVMISGSEVVSVLSEAIEIEMAGMVVAAELGPVGVIANGVLVGATDLALEIASGGTEGGVLLTEAADEAISRGRYALNFIKSKTGTVLNGMMMGTIVGLMGVQHHNAEAEKHKLKLLEEKEAREKAVGDKPLPGDPPEELANMKRLVDVLSKAELPEYVDMILNGLATTPQRVMDVLKVVRSEAYGIVVRATQEGDYENEDLVDGLMALDNLTMGERWWLLSRGKTLDDIKNKQVVRVIDCDKNWTPNPCITGDRISNKETNGMPYLFQVMFLIAGNMNMDCVDINKLNVAASGLPYVICEKKKKQWLLEMNNIINNGHAGHLSWKIITKNGVTRIVDNSVDAHSSRRAILCIDVKAKAVGTGTEPTPQTQFAWGTYNGPKNRGSIVRHPPRDISSTEHELRMVHDDWLCKGVVVQDPQHTDVHGGSEPDKASCFVDGQTRPLPDKDLVSTKDDVSKTLGHEHKSWEPHN